MACPERAPDVELWASVPAHRVEFGLDERVLCVPRLPDGHRPSPGSPLVIVEMLCPDHVKDGERPRSLGPHEDREVAPATSQNLAKQPRHVGMCPVAFEHSAEADEVDEH